jgi:hypothetical protein
MKLSIGESKMAPGAFELSGNAAWQLSGSLIEGKYFLTWRRHGVRRYISTLSDSFIGGLRDA